MIKVPESTLTEDSVQDKKFDRKNLVGQIFGKWKVLVKLDGGSYAVECACGFQATRKGYHLINQSTTQCFRCRLKERIAAAKLNKSMSLCYPKSKNNE